MAGINNSLWKKIFKVFFAIVAVITLVFVAYNIGVYTNEGNLEVFAVAE